MNAFTTGLRPRGPDVAEKPRKRRAATTAEQPKAYALDRTGRRTVDLAPRARAVHFATVLESLAMQDKRRRIQGAAPGGQG